MTMDGWALVLPRYLMEYRLLSMGYKTNLVIEDMEDEEVILRYTIISHLQEEQQRFEQLRISALSNR